MSVQVQHVVLRGGPALTVLELSSTPQRRLVDCPADPGERDLVVVQERHPEELEEGLRRARRRIHSGTARPGKIRWKGGSAAGGKRRLRVRVAAIALQMDFPRQHLPCRRFAPILSPSSFPAPIAPVRPTRWAGASRASTRRSIGSRITYSRRWMSTWTSRKKRRRQRMAEAYPRHQWMASGGEVLA